MLLWLNLFSAVSCGSSLAFNSSLNGNSSVVSGVNSLNSSNLFSCDCVNCVSSFSCLVTTARYHSYCENNSEGIN